MKRTLIMLVMTLSMLIMASSVITQAAGPQVEVAPAEATVAEATADGLIWKVGFAYGGARLTITGPDGFVERVSFGAGEALRWESPTARGGELADGRYGYEIRFAPQLSATAAAALRAASEDAEAREAAVRELVAAGELPAEMPVIAESFVVREGALLLPTATAEKTEADGEGGNGQMALSASDLAVTHDEDVFIVGGLCVGVDCDGSESFDFITVHLKENNPRLNFTDTSDAAGYPTNDWQLVANDPNADGADYFAIRDVDGATTPFRVDAGARSNALRVAANGNVGIGVGNPAALLHMINSNTPTIRMQQDRGIGYDAYTWDIRANEVSFSLRDMTAGQLVPFRVESNAPSYALVLTSAGVGLGTRSPAYPIDLVTEDEDALLVARRGGGASAFVAGSATGAQFGSLSAHPVSLLAGYDEVMGTSSAALSLGVSGTLTVTAGITPTMRLDGNGNLVLSGALTEASDVNRKENFGAVDGEAVLARLAALPISTWNYIGDDASVRHMGPMAQDFYAAFGLGADETHLAPLDVNGVTLVALQAQTRRVEALESENAELNERLANLEALVAELLAEKE